MKRLDLKDIRRYISSRGTTQKEPRMRFTFVPAKSASLHSSFPQDLGIVLKIASIQELYTCEQLLNSVSIKEMTIEQRRKQEEKMQALINYGKLYVMKNGQWTTEAKEVGQHIMQDTLQFPE